jgi:hypothetical protein
MLVPYPSDFPTYALSVIMDKLRGKPINTTTAIHAAWVVSGYALGNIIPDGPQVVGIVAGDEAEAQLVEDLLKDMQNQTAIRGFIPYVLLAEIASRLLLKLLLEGKK